MSKPNNQKKIGFFERKISRNKMVFSGWRLDRLKSKRLNKKYDEYMFYAIPVADFPVAELEW